MLRQAPLVFGCHSRDKLPRSLRWPLVVEMLGLGQDASGERPCERRMRSVLVAGLDDGMGGCGEDGGANDHCRPSGGSVSVGQGQAPVNSGFDRGLGGCFNTFRGRFDFGRRFWRRETVFTLHAPGFLANEHPARIRQCHADRLHIRARMSVQKLR